MTHLPLFRFTGALTALGLMTVAHSAMAQSPVSPVVPVSKPMVNTCPEGVAAGSRCLTGRDSFGAHYWLAVPPNWKGMLVVHSHGGPELGEPKAERAGACQCALRSGLSLPNVRSVWWHVVVIGATRHTLSRLVSPPYFLLQLSLIYQWQRRLCPPINACSKVSVSSAKLKIDAPAFNVDVRPRRHLL